MKSLKERKINDAIQKLEDQIAERKKVTEEQHAATMSRMREWEKVFEEQLVATEG
jgi:hypothetical protein